MNSIVDMPKDIKQKLIQLDILCRQAEVIENQLDFLFLSYGINPDVFKGIANEEVQTEAFADILNGHLTIECNIKKIEKVFLHYANKEI